MKIEGFVSKFQCTTQIRTENVQVGSQQKETMPTSTVTKSITEKPLSSFRLNAALKSVSDETSIYAAKPQDRVALQDEVEATDRFDSENVHNALNNYINQHKLETAVIIALQAHLPDVSQSMITLFVDNNLQLEKLNQLATHLLNFIKKALNNRLIILQFKLFEESVSNEEKRYFTSSEKFTHFVELNPVVEELQKLFALEIE